MKRILFAVLLLLAFSVSVYAQDDDAPLIAFGSDGLVLAREGSQRVTLWNQCGYSYGLRISPTGEWLARLTAGETTLRLCHIPTLEVLDIPGPIREDEELRISGTPDWSPDGSQVVWTAVYENGEHDLIVYDLETEVAEVVATGLPTPGPRPQVRWGQSGILVGVDTNDPEQIAAPLYAPDGELLAEDLSKGQPNTIYFWVTDAEGKEYLGRYQHYWSGDLLDLETGYSQFGQVEMYSLLAPEGVSVVVNYDFPSAQVMLPDGEAVYVPDLSPNLRDFVPFLQFDPTNISIAPDGEAFVIYDLDQLLWRDGEVSDLPNTMPGGDGSGVIWGPLAFRIRGELLSPLG